MDIGDLVKWGKSVRLLIKDKEVEITGLVIRKFQDTLWIKPLWSNEAGKDYFNSLGTTRVPVNVKDCILISNGTKTGGCSNG